LQRVRLWLFEDWCSRPGKLRLPKEDTKHLYETYYRGTRFSLFAPFLPPRYLNQAAPINNVSDPSKISAGNAVISSKPETTLKKV
jgi:hypothetical protein